MNKCFCYLVCLSTFKTSKIPYFLQFQILLRYVMLKHAMEECWALLYDILVYARKHVRPHIRVFTHIENPSTSERSPGPTPLSSVQSHVPNKNLVVTTETTNRCYRLLFFVPSSIVNETWDPPQLQSNRSCRQGCMY